MLLGLTGQIGAGKSTAARILHDFGACIIDADLIGKQVVENNPVLLKRLAKRFGKEILTRSGKLNRKALAAQAFASPERKAALDALVHPYLLRELHRQVKAGRQRCGVVVVDAALLLNWNLDRQVDVTLVITASQTNRLARLAARGFGTRDMLARQRAQYPLAEYRRRATYVVPNNGAEQQLRERLARIWRRLDLAGEAGESAKGAD